MAGRRPARAAPLALVAVAALLGAAGCGDADRGAPPPAPPSAETTTDARGGPAPPAPEGARVAALERAHELPWAPGRVAVHRERAWVAARDEPELALLEGPTSAPRRVRLPEPVRDLAAAGSGAWAAGETTLFHLDGQGRLARRVPVAASAVAVVGDTVWVATVAGGTSVVRRVDARSGRFVGPPAAAGRDTLALAADGRGVWAISHDERVVTRLDARSGARRSRTTLAWDPHGLALGEGGVWVADLHAGAVHGLDPATAAPSGRRVRLDLAPERLAAGLGGVWVLPASTGSAAREGDDRLVRIDPRRRRPVGTLRLGGGSPQAVAVGAGRVWAATAAPDRLLLLRPAAPARP